MLWIMNGWQENKMICFPEGNINFYFSVTDTSTPTDVREQQEEETGEDETSPTDAEELDVGEENVTTSRILRLRDDSNRWSVSRILSPNRRVFY